MLLTYSSLFRQTDNQARSQTEVAGPIWEGLIVDRKTVLVIEDDPAIRRTLKDVLEIQGFQVYVAADGKEAQEQLTRLAPEPNVILLDLMMPVMNGWQFLDFQRGNPRFKNIPVVICSAYAESAKAVGPSAFVPKPVQLPSLLGALQSLCA